MNHSLISASRNTHAKIGVMAVVVSFVFLAVVSASGVTRTDGARTHGPVVKATTTIDVAKGGAAVVR